MLNTDDGIRKFSTCEVQKFRSVPWNSHENVTFAELSSNNDGCEVCGGIFIQKSERLSQKERGETENLQNLKKSVASVSSEQLACYGGN
jgi:hypothetical protein